MPSSPALPLQPSSIQPLVFKTSNVTRFYLIIPFCFLIAFLDYYFFNSYLKAVLPDTFQTILVLNLVFNLPHILSGSLSLGRLEYYKAYEVKILLIVILSSLYCVLSVFFFQNQGIWFFSLLTASHVVGQQFGIASQFSTAPHWVYSAWKYLGISIGTLQYIKLYDMRSIQAQELFDKGLIVAAVIFCFFSIYIFLNQKNTLGRKLSVHNGLMVVTPLLFLFMGYPIFTGLIPRFIHDATAFYAYLVHNINFTLERTPNKFESKFKLWISQLSFTFLLPFVIAFPISAGWMGLTGSMIVVFCSIAHYFIEAFAWKGSSAPRNFLPIK